MRQVGLVMDFGTDEWFVRQIVAETFEFEAV